MDEFSKKPAFNAIKLDDIITQVSLPLFAFENNKFNSKNELLPSGTCVRVCGNLLITARHVIEDYIYKYGVNSKENSAEFGLWAIQILNNEDLYAVWAAERIFMSPHTDVAFIHVTPYNEAAYKFYLSEGMQVRLNLFAPEVGSRIVGFGYHSSIATCDDNGNINLDNKPTASVGEVIEIHEPYRDKIRLNFPCYRVNARFDGGMSGGPVFNDNGELCGLICSNLPPEDDSSEHISYVTTLWPSMATAINIDRGDGYSKGIIYPILDLVKDKFIAAIGWEKITLEKSQDSGFYTISRIL